MARITRPQVPYASANYSGMPTSIQVNTGVGELTARLGEQLQAEGKQFVEEANSAFQESLYSRAFSGAVEELNTGMQQRLSQQTDENGNPTFATIDSDVSKLTNDVMNKHAMQIMDLPTRQKFMASFGEYSTNKRIQASAESRMQQVQFSKVNLQNSLNKLTQQALTQDPATANMLLGEMTNTITGALSTGIISPEQANVLKDNARSSVRVGNLQRAIAQDPEQGMALLNQMDPAALDITLDEKDKLQRYAKSALDDKRIQIQKTQREQEALKKEVYNLNTAEISEKLRLGVAGLTEIEDALENDKISPLQRYSLRKEYFNRTDKEGKKQEANLVINNAINDNKVISGVTPEQISQHYADRIALISKDPATGQPINVPLQQKAQLAGQYNAPVKPIQNEIGAKVLSPNKEESANALSSYMYLATHNPRVLDGMDKQQEAILASAASIVSSTNLPIEDAIASAKDKILNADDAVRQNNARKYSKVADFKPDKIKSTIKDMYDIDSTFGLGGAEVSPDVVSVINSRLREAYEITGNKDEAVALTKRWTSSVMGETEFGGEGTNFSFMPPESIYKGIPVSSLKDDLEMSLKAKGIETNNVSLVFNPTSKNPSWFVMHYDDNGLPHMVENDKGEPEEWSFNEEEYNSEQSRIREEQLVTKREANAKEYARLKPIHEKNREATAGLYEQIQRARTQADRQMGLGDISSKYESGKGGVGAISTGKSDPGGKSYGEYQLASNTGTLQSYISSSVFSDDLSKYTPTSPEFDKEWKRLAKEHPKEFAEDQRNFITKTHFEPVRAVADDSGLPRTEAIDEVLFSMGVQHGRAASLVRKAADTLNTATATETQVVKALFKVRRDYINGLGSLSAGMKKSLLNRYVSEEKDTLNLVGDGK